MDNTTVSSDSYRRLSRRHFTKDFKRTVVEYLLTKNLTVAEVAREYNLHPNQLCRWRNEYRRQHALTHDGKQQEVSLLPVTLATIPPSVPHVIQEEQSQAHHSTPVALTITQAKGSLQVYAHCPPQLLGLAIEALK